MRLTIRVEWFFQILMCLYKYRRSIDCTDTIRRLEVIKKFL